MKIFTWFKNLFSTDLTCSSCSRKRVDHGFNYKCVVCDFDPDPRP